MAEVFNTCHKVLLHKDTNKLYTGLDTLMGIISPTKDENKGNFFSCFDEEKYNRDTSGMRNRRRRPVFAE